MSSNINVSLENPYGEVTIPRAKLRPSDGTDLVIANPGAVTEAGNAYSSSPPPYQVKEAGGEEEGGRGVCCYRCRRKK